MSQQIFSKPEQRGTVLFPGGPTVSKERLTLRPVESAEPEEPVTARPTAPVVVKLKLDPDRYLRLKFFAARERKAARAVLLAALDEYIERHAPELTGDRLRKLGADKG